MLIRHMNVDVESGLYFLALPSRAERRIARLRPSEREVARGLIDSKTNAEIARARGTSERTIANQVAAIFRIYGVRSRAELARCLERESTPGG